MAWPLILGAMAASNVGASAVRSTPGRARFVRIEDGEEMDPRDVRRLLADRERDADMSGTLPPAARGSRVGP